MWRASVSRRTYEGSVIINTNSEMVYIHVYIQYVPSDAFAKLIGERRV